MRGHFVGQLRGIFSTERGSLVTGQGYFVGQVMRGHFVGQVRGIFRT
jgi:hypothetical protein